MSEKFNQYYLIETLSKKYSHTTYLASPNQMSLSVKWFSPCSLRRLFPFPHERENLLQKAQRIRQAPASASSVYPGYGDRRRATLCRAGVSAQWFLTQPSEEDLSSIAWNYGRPHIVSQVGEALAYAHEHNIVHGNIKPENILFDANGQAVLTDFSLVSRKDAIIRDQTAEEYAFCYLAPEQFAGTCDARSDQYALGCLTYELITGRVPFAAQSLSSMMGQPSNTLPAPTL